MKKLFCTLFACCSFTLFAQEKTINFDNRLSYNLEVSDEVKQLYPVDDVFQNLLHFYIGKEAMIGHSESEYMINGFTSSAFLFMNNRSYDVKLNLLENEIGIKNPTILDYSPYKEYTPYSIDYTSKNNQWINLNRLDKINGYECNYYQLVEDKSPDNKTLFCVDEKNPINNIKFFAPSQPIKGLIVKMDFSTDQTSLILNTVDKSSLQVKFNESKAIADFEKNLESVKNQYAQLYDFSSEIDTATAVEAIYPDDNRFEDPLYEYYTYATSDQEHVNHLFTSIASTTLAVVTMDNDFDNTYDFDRNKVIKSGEESAKKMVQIYKKNGLINKNEAKELNSLFKTYFDEAKKFQIVKINGINPADAIALETESYDSIEDTYIELNYQSLYKNSSLKELEFAIDNPDVQPYLSLAPEYCNHLKNNIPAFTNQELKNIVHQYAGQICDLYIYNSGYVDLNSTIDALRKSVLELNKKYESFSKEDKEKLKKFFDSLD